MNMIKYLLALVLVLQNTGGEKFLNDITLYQTSSYFKQQVYLEHDTHSFFELPAAKALIDPDDYDLHLLNAALFYATNEIRIKKNRKPLIFDAALRDAAVVHTYQMVQKNFFNHYNTKVPKLRSPENRIRLFMGTGTTAGENIDWNHIETGEASYAYVGRLIAKDFYESSAHRKNMLSNQYKKLGCSVFFENADREGVRYFKATQDFCAP